MTKQMIEVDIPEGYEFVRYGLPVSGDYYLGLEGYPPLFAHYNPEAYIGSRIVIKKKQPERIIFEKSFERRRAKYGEYIIGLDGEIILWSLRGISKDKYYILTKVEE